MIVGQDRAVGTDDNAGADPSLELRPLLLLARKLAKHIVAERKLHRLAPLSLMSDSIRTTAGEVFSTTSAYDVRTPSTETGCGGAAGC